MYYICTTIYEIWGEPLLKKEKEGIQLWEFSHLSIVSNNIEG